MARTSEHYSAPVMRKRSAKRAVLFVDPAVDHASDLVAGLDLPADVIHLEPTCDGLVQIARHLAGRRNVPSLHILCHGTPGALRLAGWTVDMPALRAHAEEMAAIAAALAPDATVVLYGCAVADGPVGLRFQERLEAMLGVPVAASKDPVGAAALGGSWTLHTGAGDRAIPAFTPEAREAFPALLEVTA